MALYRVTLEPSPALNLVGDTYVQVREATFSDDAAFDLACLVWDVQALVPGMAPLGRGIRTSESGERVKWRQYALMSPDGILYRAVVDKVSE